MLDLLRLAVCVLRLSLVVRVGAIYVTSCQQLLRMHNIRYSLDM